MAFRDQLVAKALQQWEWFGKDRGRVDKYIDHSGKTTLESITNGQTNRRKETVEPFADRVGDFWLAMPTKDYDTLVKNYARQKGKLDGTIDLPWSAAFISYSMQVAGAGTAFPYAAGHAAWIVASIRNRQKNKLKASLVGYRLGEVPLQVGDLIGRPRGDDKNLKYDEAVAKGWFSSHSDIVVEIDSAHRKAFVIGGNVGQSVSKCDVSITADGKLDDPDGWFVHIRNNIENKPNEAIASLVDPAAFKVG
ncbi:DUF2272 domain-containing protein [Martelella alba]|uniref:DUF2272 domain-containing protein n=1 Tax=Martelella alba TaxID=2590451 RepID=A0A506U148_9HYPH|nr:DUF2272 domain-containing protein [Martelella alba]TPW27218.1 DUF2272 domain-containing protein [Martelella alba]